MAVTGDDGTYYFTGYIAVTPLPEYVGFALEGPRYRIAIQALSDELLLDQNLAPSSVASVGQSVGQLITSMVTRTGIIRLSTQGIQLGTAVSYLSLIREHPEARAPDKWQAWRGLRIAL